MSNLKNHFKQNWKTYLAGTAFVGLTAFGIAQYQAKKAAQNDANAAQTEQSDLEKEVTQYKLDNKHTSIRQNPSIAIVGDSASYGNHVVPEYKSPADIDQSASATIEHHAGDSTRVHLDYVAPLDDDCNCSATAKIDIYIGSK